MFYKKLDKVTSLWYYKRNFFISADLAHPVERHLAKVEVASSSLVIRSTKRHFSVMKNVGFLVLGGVVIREGRA